MNGLERIVAKTGEVPVSFAMGRSYANLGDALSPLMVALLAGKPITHAAMQSKSVRLAAVGTIAHGMNGGEVHVWGAGTSRYSNPHCNPQDRRLFAPQEAARFYVHATRGPITREILGASHWMGAPAYGDPVWLLPQFYQPKIEKKWDLGVIVHLADLAERSVDCRVKQGHVRYFIPESLSGSITLINTVTDATVPALQARLDKILSCRRLVSTSLHGMVFAESYGIPCLYFGTRSPKNGLFKVELTIANSIDLRIADLYRGVGQDTLMTYSQKRREYTDWDDLITKIDQTWEPISFDTTPLLDAFPMAVAPFKNMQGQSIFDLDLVQNIPTQHALNRMPGFGVANKLLRRAMRYSSAMKNPMFR